MAQCSSVKLCLLGITICIANGKMVIRHRIFISPSDLLLLILQGDKQDENDVGHNNNSLDEDDDCNTAKQDNTADEQDKSWLERQTGLTKEDIEHDMEDMTLVGGKIDNVRVNEIFKQVKVQDDLIPSHSVNLDMKAFVEVFPYGTGGSTVDRDVPITKAQFEKTQLLSSDGNLRRNTQYHFHNMQQKEFRDVSSGVFMVTNKGSGKMTKKQLEQGVNDNDPNLIKKISTLLGNLPTQNEFWRRIQQKIMAMIDKYGPPTWWLTLSPGEYDDDELYAYLKKMNSDLPGVNDMKLSTLICKDPTLAGHFINKKFEAMYDFILDSEVIGLVGAYNLCCVLSFPCPLKYRLVQM